MSFSKLCMILLFTVGLVGCNAKDAYHLKSQQLNPVIEEGNQPNPINNELPAPELPGEGEVPPSGGTQPPPIVIMPPTAPSEQMPPIETTPNPPTGGSGGTQTPPIVIMPPTAPSEQLPPIVTLPPTLPGPGQGPSYPIIDPEDPKINSCKNEVSFTNIHEGAKVTVVSGRKVDLADFMETRDQFAQLASMTRDFFQKAIIGFLEPGTVFQEFTQTGQRQIRETINSKDSYYYSLKGGKPIVSFTQFRPGSKIFIYSEAEELKVSFNQFHSDAEIFVMIANVGDNINCVSSNGAHRDAEVSSFVFGDPAHVTRSMIKTTTQEGRSVRHEVSGGDQTISIFSSTTVHNTSIDLITKGGHDTMGLVKATNFHGNDIKVDLQGQDNTFLRVRNTTANQNTSINMNLVGESNTGAKITCTSCGGLSISGQITAQEDPYLDLARRILGSQVRVDLIENK